MTTDNPTLQSEKLKPCKWCADGDVPKFLDLDGTLVSITGNDGILSHAHDVYWWPCLKFGVELRCSRAPVVAPRGDVPLFEAKLLGFGEGDRITLCEPCLRQAIANHLVSFSSALPPSPPSSPVPPEQSYSAGFDDAARVSRVLNQVAATPTPVEQERSLSDVLHDAGAVLCRSAPDVGASVEIRFANLLDAQRLHKALVSIREAWTATPSPSVREAARAAAKDIREWIGISGMVDGEGLNEVAAIIERHCSPVSAAGDDEDRKGIAGVSPASAAPASPSPAEGILEGRARAYAEAEAKRLARWRERDANAAHGKEDKCAWTLDDSNDGDVWETGCGETFQFTDGGPAENHFTYCYKCGTRIDAARYSDFTSVGEGNA